MKRRFPSFILGATVGFAFAVSPVVYGATKNAVQAVFEKFYYEVDGVKSNVDEPALVHNGSSYLNTRTIAGILGYKTVYDSETRTIKFISKAERNIGEMKSIDSIQSQIQAIEQQIQELDKEIMFTTRAIEGTERTKDLMGFPNSDKNLEESIKKLETLKQRKAELEAQKAELEAQLQAQQ